MQRKRKAKHAERDAPASTARPKEGSARTDEDTYGPEPYRADRPSLEELGGLSEFEATAASAAENLSEGGDPLRPMASAPERSSREEEVAVSPEDLGRRFLKEAVQDPSPVEPADDDVLDSTIEEDEETEAFDEVSAGGAYDDESPAPLTTHLDDGTEQEREISEKAQAEVGRRVRRRRQAGKPPHTH